MDNSSIFHRAAGNGPIRNLIKIHLHNFFAAGDLCNLCCRNTLRQRNGFDESIGIPLNLIRFHIINIHLNFFAGNTDYTHQSLYLFFQYLFKFLSIQPLYLQAEIFSTDLSTCAIMYSLSMLMPPTRKPHIPA